MKSPPSRRGTSTYSESPEIEDVLVATPARPRTVHFDGMSRRTSTPNGVRLVADRIQISEREAIGLMRTRMPVLGFYSDDFPCCFDRATDSETVAFSLSDLSARFLTARNCMSLILKMKTSAESGL